MSIANRTIICEHLVFEIGLSKENGVRSCSDKHGS